MQDANSLVNCFHSAITIVQRQTTVLMVAVNSDDRDLAMISCERVRAALRQAERIATALGKDFVEARALLAARVTAAPWLSRAPKIANVNDAQRLIERFGIRRLPSAYQQDDLADLDLDGVDLSSLDISRIRFIGVHAREALLAGTVARDVTWEWCDFSSSTMIGTRFDHGIVADCNFDRCALQRSHWFGVVALRTSLRAADLTDAELDGAMFTDCDLRDADLGAARGAACESHNIIMFLRCDLRGSSWRDRNVAGIRFVECKLQGAHGVPRNRERAEIEAADMSIPGDGSVVVTDAASVWP